MFELCPSGAAQPIRISSNHRSNVCASSRAMSRSCGTDSRSLTTLALNELVLLVLHVVLLDLRDQAEREYLVLFAALFLGQQIGVVDSGETWKDKRSVP